MNITDLLLDHTQAIRDAMALLNRNTKGIAFVVDGQRKLLGSVTDGDIRRALLHGARMDDAIATALHTRPVVAPAGTPGRMLAAIMDANRVRQLPLVSETGELVDVYFAGTGHLSDKLSAVIMAGGEGMRLRPLTDTMPKPMLSVGGRPLLETIIRALKASGHQQIFINVRYLAHVIEEYFGDGSSLGVEIHYLREPLPLGTAGGLSLIPKDLWPRSSFLVVNGDLLTTLNFRLFRDYHMSEGSAVTLVGRPYEVTIPFGYPVMNGDVVTDWSEKPTFTYLVNSGIYCLEPDLLNLVPSGQMYNMPDLIQHACRDGRRVGVFPLREPFHEIGRVDSYREAEEFYRCHFAPADVQKKADQ